jgi:L-cysteine S-thiosulfotransferase
MRRALLLVVTLTCVSLSLESSGGDAPALGYQPWVAKNLSVQEPLGGLKGDAANGRKVAVDRGKGNCLACHKMPIPEEEFPGELGPSLEKVGKKFSEGKLRFRIINIQLLNPRSLMPPFYKKPEELNRVVERYQGHTILTAQEVEDVVAYLMTLK